MWLSGFIGKCFCPCQQSCCCCCCCWVLVLAVVVVVCVCVWGGGGGGTLGMGVCVHWPVCHTLWFPCIFGQIAYKFDSNLVNTYIMHYGPPPAWLTFGGVLHWISNVFWPLIGWAVSTYFQTNRWSYLSQIWRTNSLWASSCLISYALWFSVVSWPLIDRAVSKHSQTNHWLDWAQIWWANSSWASPACPVKFWSCST